MLPTALRKRALLALAHEGLQGIVKTKALVREKIWFPGLKAAVEHQISNCLLCQAVGPPQKPEPLIENDGNAKASVANL